MAAWQHAAFLFLGGLQSRLIREESGVDLWRSLLYLLWRGHDASETDGTLQLAGAAQLEATVGESWQIFHCFL